MEFIGELTKTLYWVTDQTLLLKKEADAAEMAMAADSKQPVPVAVNREQLLRFLKQARNTYGKTALCLSGGFMMGSYHLGHIKGLMETDCLPHIMSGCSVGSGLAAILCTRTNDELPHDLDPQVIGPHLKFFNRSWSECIASAWKTGNLLTGDDWLTMVKWYVFNVYYYYYYWMQAFEMHTVSSN